MLQRADVAGLPDHPGLGAGLDAGVDAGAALLQAEVARINVLKQRIGGKGAGLPKSVGHAGQAASASRPTQAESLTMLLAIAVLLLRFLGFCRRRDVVE